jgi:hypothetical protein
LRSRRSVRVPTSSKETLATLGDPNGPKAMKRWSLKVQNLMGQSQQLKVKRLPNLRSELVKLILTPQALVVTLNDLNVWGKGILHLNVLTKELRLLKKIGKVVPESDWESDSDKDNVLLAEYGLSLVC